MYGLKSPVVVVSHNFIYLKEKALVQKMLFIKTGENIFPGMIIFGPKLLRG